MKSIEFCSPMRPDKMAEALYGAYGRVVEVAVFPIARSAGIDAGQLLDEVKSELALTMLSGGFDGLDPSRGKLKAYLATAARNKARSLLRKRSQGCIQSWESAEGEIVPAASSERSPVADLLHVETRKELESAMHYLEETDPQGFAILKALYFDNLKYEEIAHLPGMPGVHTLHLRAHRARRRLASILNALPEAI